MDYNLDVFTQEERVKVQHIIDTGDWKNLTGVIISGDLTPAKEGQMQKILNSLKKDSIGFESKVRQEFNEWLTKGNKIQNPQEEEEWQKRISDEYQNWLKEKENKLNSKEDSSKLKVSVPASNSPVEDTPTKPKSGRKPKILTQ